MSVKYSLYDATLPQLEQIMQEWKQPAFRARQLYRQAYINLSQDFSTMTDLPQVLRERLAANLRNSNLHLTHVQTAENGLTRKALFTLHDSVIIETVLLIYHDRQTVCVSTQAGCGMGCTFCATGQAGLQRNLTTGEIVEQVLWAAREIQTLSNEPQTSNTTLNVVFMGMGEPFANYDNWWSAVERLHDPKGFNLGARHMTVSTVGLVPGICRLAHEPLPINLAISLHAPDDELRNQLVPVNRRYPIAAVLDAACDYIASTNRRVSFEYVLLHGYNDQPEHAHRLAQQLRKAPMPGPTFLFHVNLIPWNAVPGMPLGSSAQKRITAFQHIVQEYNIACTVRVERGTEIAAACGQLAGTQQQPGETS
jgi:23S rRNA (adenine2503-C2)-methyltransferase